MPTSANHRFRGACPVGLWALLAGLALAPPHLAAQFAAPPVVTGPIASGNPGDAAHDYVFLATPMDLARAGYVEQEYFVAGTATRYVIPPDGSPATSPGTMPYHTRLVVRRPVNPDRFSGGVVVDWQNVSSGFDANGTWASSGDFFVRSGWAWVGASVQRVGVHGFDPPNPLTGTGLKQWSPSRYGALDVSNGGAVTDDSQAYDIYSQVAHLLKHPEGVDPMAGLRVQRVYAAGGSQSAAFLVRYYNELQARTRLYDAFFIINGGGRPRLDQPTKLFKVYTEADAPSQAAVRVPDTGSTHTWEIAGAPHMPAVYQSQDPHDFRAIAGGLAGRDVGRGLPDAQCLRPYPSPVESWLVVNAAYAALDRWVTAGAAPATTAPLETAPGPDGQAYRVVRDERGLARGGIRRPRVAVPTALNTGENQPAGNAPENGVCGFLGTSIPFDGATLQALYPTREDYMREVRRVVDGLMNQGIVLREDVDTLVREADAALP